jgi:hypothetical protein
MIVESTKNGRTLYDNGYWFWRLNDEYHRYYGPMHNMELSSDTWWIHGVAVK